MIINQPGALIRIPDELLGTNKILKLFQVINPSLHMTIW